MAIVRLAMPPVALVRTHPLRSHSQNAKGIGRIRPGFRKTAYATLLDPPPDMRAGTDGQLEQPHGADHSRSCTGTRSGASVATPCAPKRHEPFCADGRHRALLAGLGHRQRNRPMGDDGRLDRRGQRAVDAGRQRRVHPTAIRRDDCPFEATCPCQFAIRSVRIARPQGTGCHRPASCACPCTIPSLGSSGLNSL